jgi:predicted CoA-substrate-specific enzyme activase
MKSSIQVSNYFRATAGPDHTEGCWAGIDAGAVSLNCVVINPSREIVCELRYRRHLGKVEECVVGLVQELREQFSEGKLRSVSFTGSHGRTLAERLGTFYEFETICQVTGALHLAPDARTIISVGGQQTALFQIGQNDGSWELEHFNSNGPCASGTGSFIDQQAERLATSLYFGEKDAGQKDIDKILADFIELGLTSETPAHVACRCTVFTKSDMIHLQNKGERLEDIIYGLHMGNARNYMSTIVGNRTLQAPVLFIGGLSLNRLQVMAFRSYFPGIVVPPSSTSMGALGAALLALKTGSEHGVDLERLEALALAEKLTVPTAPRLTLTKGSFPDAKEITVMPRWRNNRVYLGIDIGSTSTKYALINEKREIIHKNYVPTQGRPIEVTQRLLGEMQSEIGNRIEIAGAATTGSGRIVVGDFLNVDLIIDEITAHARGAVEIEPAVDTIFEIGGQDSKYISIVNTHPLDFDMNKVCAAGTGSFLHELANKFGLNIVREFQDVALSSLRPVKLAERCTVFMESDLTAYHQKGVPNADLMAGLCYAIVHNYLNRVVGRRPIGRRVMFLGGPSLNKAVVAAFEIVLGRGLILPAHREVLGAYGAAISVQERMRSGQFSTTRFRGLGKVLDEPMQYVEKVCISDATCHNQCKLKIYQFEGRKSVWGGECGRYELRKNECEKKEDYFALRQQIWKSHLAGVGAELGEKLLYEVNGRPTVGIQRALYSHQTAILWTHFFDRLGFEPVLSPPTNAGICEAGIASTMSETCYPAKVSQGHVKALLGKTAYLFLPTMITMATVEPAEVGYYCPIVQSNSYMVRGSYDVNLSSLLNPVIHLKYDPDTLTVEIAEQIGPQLRASRRAIRAALAYALDRQDQFVRELHRKGQKILTSLCLDEPAVLVTGRPYNLYDERLNLKLGHNLAKAGLIALPMDFIDVTSVDLSDFSSMYWGLGAQILRTAKLIKERPQYFGLHLTNFGCGPDSFIEHFYKHVMGNKPYLILELDEHTAVAGVMTRLEAYKNVIDNTLQKERLTRKSEGKVEDLKPWIRKKQAVFSH